MFSCEYYIQRYRSKDSLNCLPFSELKQSQSFVGWSSLMNLKALGLGVALTTLPLAYSSIASADTFNLTSCHISTGCPTAGTVFGTVTLNQVGSNVTVDVVLLNGSRFVETG